MSNSPYRPDIEEPPHRIKRLPVHRGYPVPYFVGRLHGEPEFRLADPEKLYICTYDNRCWICGDVMGTYKTFVIGPMCSVNRISAEPPSHKECAQYAVRNCPFLAKPHMTRREDEVTSQGVNPGGVMIKRNPGVMCVWTTKSYRLLQVENGMLFKIGDPTDIEWYREGRCATREEIDIGIETGLPLLEEEARKSTDPMTMAALHNAVERLKRLLP